MIIGEILIYATLFLALYFQVFLLITFLEQFPHIRKNEKEEPALLPTVAIIVPCFNEEKTVAGTLSSLLALTYPSEKLEIIAVNDGSTDETLRVLRDFEKYPAVHVITKENGGKHSAMNVALAHTDAELVGCLDADSFVEHDALMHVVRHFSNPDVAAVTPSIKIHNAETLVQFIQRAEYGLAVFVRKSFALMDALFITPGPFSFFRHSVLREVGPWRHGHSTEDLEICLRIQHHHKRVVNEHRAIVHTTAPANLPALFKQRVRWTYGFIKNAQDYSHMFFNPAYGPLGLVVLPMSIISLVAAVVLLGLMFSNVLLFVWQELVRFQTVGITTTGMQFDLFYMNTNVLFSATLAVVLLTFLLMGIGKWLSRDRSISIDMPIYIAAYGFLAPFWLATALYRAVANTGVRWR